MTSLEKVKTDIEKSVIKFMNVVSEHAYDFVHLYARRNGMLQSPEEQQAMKQTLEIIRLAMKDGQLSKIDGLHQEIFSAIKDLVDVPLEKQKKQSTKA